MEDGLNVSDLLESNVFKLVITHDSWPSNHFNDSEELRVYHGNLFQAYNQYSTVFPEEDFKHLDMLSPNKIPGKLHKIEYSINLFAMCGEYIERKESYDQ